MAGRPFDAASLTGYVALAQLGTWTPQVGAAALARLLKTTAAVALLAAAVLSGGGPAARWAAPLPEDRLRLHLRWIAGAATGSGLLLGLGLAGLLQAGVLGMLLAGGGVAGLAALPRPAWRDRTARADAGVLAPALLTVAGAGVVISLLAALAPQVGYDALVYYDAAPLRALRRHRVVCEALMPVDGFMHGFEMLFLPALLVGGRPAAKLLNWTELALAGLALRAWLRGPAAAPAAALFWTLPLTGWIPGFAPTDGPVIHAAVAGAWAWRRGRGRWTAALAGWAFACKYSAALAAAPLAVAALAGARRPALAAALAAAPVLPWLARNWLGHGSPVYPLLGSAFPGFEEGRVLAPFGDTSYTLRGADGGPGGALARLWTAHAGYGEGCLPAFGVLWAWPLALAPGGGGLGALCAAALALWTVLGHGVLRYLMPAVPWILAAAFGRPWPPRTRRALARGAGAFAAVQLAFALDVGWHALNPLAVVAGAEAPAAYLAKLLPPPPHYLAMATRTRGWFARGRTYLLGETRSAYWDGDFLHDEPSLKPRLASWLEETHDLAGLAARFRQEDVRHVVYRVEGMASMDARNGRAFAWTPERLARWQAFWGARMEFRDDLVRPGENVAYYVFDVVPRAARPRPPAAVPFTFPGTEPMTFPGDAALAAGDRGRARRWFTRQAARWPGFAIPRERLGMLEGGR